MYEFSVHRFIANSTMMPARCDEHPDAKIVGACVQCGKPVCLICFGARGYLCSEACREAAQRNAAPPDKQIPPQTGPSQRTCRNAFSILVRFAPIVLGALIVLAIAARVLDRSGAECWRHSVPPRISFTQILASGNTVYALRSDGICVALNAANGKQKWETQLWTSPPPRKRSRHEPRARPVGGVFEQALDERLVCRVMGRLCALNTMDGQQAWKRTLAGSPHCPPVIGSTHTLAPCLLATAATSATPQPHNEPQAPGAFFPEPRPETIPLLACLNTSSGAERWTRPYRGRVIEALAIAGEFALCAHTPAPTWQWQPCPGHAGRERHEVFNCNKCRYVAVPAARHDIDAISLANGTLRWTSPMEAGSVTGVYAFTNSFLLCTEHDVYLLGFDGKQHARIRLPAKPAVVRTCGPHAVLATDSGRLLALHVPNARILWEAECGGTPLDFQLTPHSVYLRARIVRRKTDKPTARALAPISPDTPGHVRDWRRDYGPERSKTIGMRRPAAHTLINAHLATGKERWRIDGFSGYLTTAPNGHIQLEQGTRAAAHFISGTGSILTEHRLRDGKPCWKRKIPEATRGFQTGPSRIFLINEPGQTVAGAPWNNDALPGFKIRAFRRRTRLNRIRKP